MKEDRVFIEVTIICARLANCNRQNIECVIHYPIVHLYIVISTFRKEVEPMSNRMRSFAISMASSDPEIPALELRRILQDADLIAAKPLTVELLSFLRGLLDSTVQHKHSVTISKIGRFDTSGTLELDGIILPMGTAINISSKEYGQDLVQIGIDTERWYLLGNGEALTSEELMDILGTNITIALMQFLGNDGIHDEQAAEFTAPALSMQPGNRESGRSQREAPSVLFSLVLLGLALVTFFAHWFVMTTFFTTMFGMYVSHGKVRWLLLLLGVGVMVMLLLK